MPLYPYNRALDGHRAAAIVPSMSDDRPTRAPGPWTVTACLALLCAIWGSTYLVIREGLTDLPPLTAAGIRFAVAGAVLALLAPALSRREGGRRPTIGLTLAHGLCNIAACYGIVYWAEITLPSGLVSLLWAVYPLMIAASGHVFLPNERMSAGQWLGLVVGFGGVGWLFATDLRAIGPDAIPAGVILLGSPLIYTLGTTIIKRHGGGTSSILINRNGVLIGAAVLLALAFLFERDAELRWTPRAIFSVVYLSLIGTVVTFSLYFWLMRFASATKLSLIAYVIPAVALTLGAVVADEPFGLGTLGGMVLILAGVAGVNMGGARRRLRARRIAAD